MKTQILFILSVLCLVSVTHASSYLGSAPERGIIITVNPDKSPSKTGDVVLIKGTIKVVKKGSQSGNPHKNLLEEFKAQGIDIVGTFPSFAVDISSELNLEGVSGSEIRFSYQSKSIIADDLNQFSLKVYNNHTNKDVHKKLAVIQAKLARRLQLLANLKKKFEGGKATQNAIAAIEKEIAKLSSISSKIAQKLNANENLMAENTYALQVDSAIANYSNVSTVMNDFRFSVFSDIGTAFQGTKINLKSQILSLSQARRSSDTSVEEDDGYLAEFYFNGQRLSSQKIIEPRKNLDVVFNYQTEKLNPTNANIFLVELYHLENGAKARKIGSLNYKVPVIADTVKPIWLGDSIPNQQDRYTQQLRPIRLKAQDSLSGIDPTSFKLSLSSQNAIKDLSQSILYSMFNDGEIYEFTGDINPLDEGEYALAAKVSDLAGNLADDYNLTFHIDRTAPVVNTTLTNNSLTNKTSIEVPITVSDLSPVATDIYVNNELVMTSALKEFSASATLTIEGNNTIRIESKDAAGNVASIQSFLVIRDSVAPTLADNNPATYLTNVLPKSLTFNFSSNENLAFVEVNGNSAQIVSGSQIIYTRNYTSEGSITLNVKIRDAAGNETTNTFNYDLSFDNIAPTIQIGQFANLTNQSDVLIHFTVTDEHATSTQINVNNTHLATIAEKSFSYLIPLTVEGENEIKISVTDAAGNASTESVIKITKDTTPPQLLSSIPANSANIDSSSFNVSGLSSEKLAVAKLNGNALALDSSGKQISGTYISNSQGQVSLVWSLEDTAGNASTYEYSVNIQQKLLNPELVMIAPSQDGLHLRVYGGIGATRAASHLNITTGMFSFNTAAGTSNVDGSFSLELDLFTTGQLKVTDATTGQVATMPLSYQVNTVISGLVLDTNSNPLVGATISVQGASITTTTNAAGTFQFNAGRTGDQVLVIDGSTIPQSSMGPTRTFFKTNISINIGIGQNNALSRPIYLHPLIKDGTETSIKPNLAATVESPHAPGSVLEIASNATVFPNGTSSGSISITQIDADKATIEAPSSALPEKVLALEPSGTQFRTRVELTLPNDSELPAGTEMLIMSMNSKKGSWEIDGHAKVTEDGSSVVTTPGNGISHFSLVYAIPVKPVIAEIADPNLVGIDISKGSMSTSFMLPSYSSLGNKITPMMTYKSSWSNPTAVVSNLFDIPMQEVSFEYKTNTNGIGSHLHKFYYKYCGFKGIKWTCWDRSKDYWVHAQVEDDFKTKTMYKPDSIKSQFFISSIASNEITYQDIPAASATSSLPGVVFKEGVGSTVGEMVGLPNQSMISYAVNLKDPANNQYLESGMYPSLARFQVKLKAITLTSFSRKTTTYVDGNVNNVVPESNDSETTTLLDEALPSDINSNVIVQNKTKSPYGRGWKLNFAQKIINPTNNQIVIEEEDGGLSTYSLNNTISTIYNGQTLGVSFGEVANLTAWPNVLTQKTDSTLSNFAVRVETGGSGASVINLGKINEITGKVGNQGAYICPQQNYNGNYNSTTHNYNVKAKIRDLVMLPDGTIFGTNSSEHSIFRFVNSVYRKMTGKAQPNEEFIDMPTAQVANYCTGNLGVLCAGPVTVNTQSCAPYRPGYTGVGFPELVESVGIFPVGSYAGDNLNNSFGANGQRISFGPNDFSYPIGMNSPRSMVVSPDGFLVVADTGNNRVRKINLSTNVVTTLAGDGSNIDAGDNGPATSAKIFRPRGLVYDSQGNLYISTENGYIRKVDQAGTITTLAGMPLGSGGILSNEAPAASIALINPTGMVYDEDHNFIYVADTGNNRVVRIDLTTMIASNVAGNGSCAASQDENVAALSASICAPLAVGLDTEKNLVVANSGANKIQLVRFNNSSNGSLSFSPTNKDSSNILKNADGTWVRTIRNGTKIYFNSKGLQTAATDRIGNVIQYQYNGADQLTKFTDPKGQDLVVNYSGDKVSSIVNPAGQTTYFEFDGDNLKKITYPDNSTKRFSYDSNGQMISEFDGLEKETKYEYNSHGRLTKIIQPSLHETVINDIESQSIGSTKLASATLTGEGYRTIIKDDETTSEYSTNFNGMIIGVKDTLGRITKYNRDEYGDVTGITYPDSTRMSFSFDSNTHDMLSATDEQTGVSTYKKYDSFGNTIETTDGRGYKFVNEYDPVKGLLLKSKTPLVGQETSYTYNSDGQVTIESKKLNNVSYDLTYEYDSRGNVSKVVDRDGKVTEYEYDLAGNIIRQSKLISAGVKVHTFYEYDQMNRLKKVISPKQEVTKIAYTPRGEVESIVDAESKVSTFLYNNIVNQLARKVASTGEIHNYEYYPNGMLMKEIDPNNNPKVYEYDVLKQIKKISLTDDVLEYDYDYKGRTILAKNKNSKIDYTRNVFGRVTQDKLTGQGAFAAISPLLLDYQYDGSLNMISVTANNSLQFQYDYDPMNRLQKITSPYSGVFNFQHDDYNRITKITRPNGESNFTYRKNSKIETIDHKLGNLSISSFGYVYDGRNLVTQRTSTNVTENYFYDDNGQIIDVRSPTNSTESFSYDGLGNRLSDLVGSYIYNTNTKRLTEDANYFYAYDNNGNITAKNPKNSSSKAYRFKYTSQNQLREVSILPNANGSVEQVITYDYDVLGRRMRKTIQDMVTPVNSNLSFYQYDGDSVILESKFSNQVGSSELVGIYTHGLLTDDVLAVYVPPAGVTYKKAKVSGNYYFLKDGQGTISALASASGQISQKYVYSSFGEITKVLDGSGLEITNDLNVDNQYTFTGREFDKETKTYFFRARTYDPSTGRFLQQDPHPGDIRNPASYANKYNYVENSPLNFLDLMGLKKSIQEDERNGDPSSIHGNFCGKNATGANGGSIDNLDDACRKHDSDYGTWDDVWKSNLGNSSNRVRGDFRLLKASLNHLLNARSGHDLEVGLKMTFASLGFLWFSITKFFMVDLKLEAFKFIFKLVGIKLW